MSVCLVGNLTPGALQKNLHKVEKEVNPKLMYVKYFFFYFEYYNNSLPDILGVIKVISVTIVNGYTSVCKRCPLVRRQFKNVWFLISTPIEFLYNI